MADNNKGRFTLPATGGPTKVNPAILSADFPFLPLGLGPNNTRMQADDRAYYTGENAIFIAPKKDMAGKVLAPLPREPVELEAVRIVGTSGKAMGPGNQPEEVVVNMGSTLVTAKSGSAVFMFHLKEGQMVGITNIRGGKIVLSTGGEADSAIFAAPQDMQVIVVVPPGQHGMKAGGRTIQASDMQTLDERIAAYSKMLAANPSKISQLQLMQENYSEIKSTIAAAKAQIEIDKKNAPDNWVFNAGEVRALQRAADNFNRFPSPYIKVVTLGVNRLETFAAKQAPLTDAETAEKKEIQQLLPDSIKRGQSEIAEDKTGRFSKEAVKAFEEKLKKLEELKNKGKAAAPIQTSDNALAGLVSGVDLTWAAQAPAGKELPADIKGDMAKRESVKTV